jgi:hypothetical protein
MIDEFVYAFDPITFEWVTYDGYRVRPLNLWVGPHQPEPDTIDDLTSCGLVLYDDFVDFNLAVSGIEPDTIDEVIPDIIIDNTKE